METPITDTARETEPPKPSRPERGEVRGGGYIVIMRDKAGRLKAPFFPFEWDTPEKASTEAARLADAKPGKLFVVLQQIDAKLTPKPPEPEPVAGVES